MISICLPTRSRPELFKRFCVSVLDGASDPDNIEFVVYRDNDDDSVYEYIGNRKEVVGDRILQSAMYNECYKVAKGPIYMFAADDIVFNTKDWDKYVINAFENSADKIIFAYPNDENYRARFGTTGFLHKNWIDTVGYFLPPYFAAQRADNWINAIAWRINRQVFLEPVVIRQDWINDDKTHIEYNEREIKYNSKGIYFSKEKKIERERDAQLLLKFIDNYGT